MLLWPLRTWSRVFLNSCFFLSPAAQDNRMGPFSPSPTLFIREMFWEAPQKAPLTRNFQNYSLKGLSSIVLPTQKNSFWMSHEEAPKPQAVESNHHMQRKASCWVQAPFFPRGRGGSRCWGRLVLL